MEPINITVVIERDTDDEAVSRFLVIEIQDEDGNDLSHLVDSETYYASEKALAKDLPRQYKIIEMIET